MTSAEFLKLAPKPWHLVPTGTGFSVRAANGTAIAFLSTSQRHTSIPQNEWNRHFAGVLREMIPVFDESPVRTTITTSTPDLPAHDGDGWG